MDMASFSLPLARYRYEWIVRTELRLPEYAGSALRGVFGGWLRKLACLARQPECTGCTIVRSCPYALIFETPAPEVSAGERGFGVVPNPYVIEPPPWGRQVYAPGETLVFHQVLVGQALQRLPLVMLAWQRGMAHGVGPGNGTADLHRVVLEGVNAELEIYNAAQGVIQDHPTEVTAPPWEGGDRLRLALLTPTRIHKDGSPLGPGRLRPRDVLVALMRRISQMAAIHCGRSWPLDYTDLAEQATGIHGYGNLSWRDWTRRSSRQGQTMALGGVVGHWTLEGDLRSFWPFVTLGSWLHVGKNATFGLGGYRLMREGS
ncbi:MAG: CRISPR system precrRNA processing endoribonuclease RAMP protein Cas6 [Magnetococcales bacterium]|nr:CRISPR system precrRNA processing endoribonuclease RAMP protein Cas6 [Magnetococcales bacterium]